MKIYGSQLAPNPHRMRIFPAEKGALRSYTSRLNTCTLEEVGKLFAVTRERIRQIEAKALRKLRQTGRSRNLEGFMERE